MAVLPMKRICVIGLKHDRKSILEALQRYGTVEITNDDLSELGFSKTDTSSSQAVFAKSASAFNQAIEIIERYSPEKTSLFSSLEGKKEISKEEYYTFVDDSEEITDAVNRILSLNREIAEKQSDIVKLEAQVAALKPWMTLDIPISFSGTKKTAAFTGIFPEERTLESLLSEYKLLCGEKELPAEFEVISASAEQTCVFVLCNRKYKNEVETVLRSMGFSRPAVSSDKPPAQRTESIKKEIEIAREKIKKAEQELTEFGGFRNAFKFMADYYVMRIEKYRALGMVNQQKRIFTLCGYIPEKDAKTLEAELSHKYNAAVEITDLSEEDDPPVVLQNNGFASPLESVVESYSLPGRNESDPTSVMALFYYFLFGIMLSDAAYGAIITIGCALALLKFKSMESGMKKFLKMFMYCGISTVFWGIMFGSYFGDAVTVIAKTFFNKDIVIAPVWFTPANYAMDMLLFSFLVGIVHLFTGLGMKMAALIKEHKPLDAIWDVISWYLLIGGAIIYLMSAQVFVNMVGLKFILPASVGKAAAICACIGAAIIIFMAGRSSQSFFIRIAKGLYELYGATSYLSDILSYSRLLALGLATGVIASVFNKMGSMLGGGIGGAIFFTVVFLVGHSLNLSINLLGAYVHTNRLQFVEFFGKFYEGGGRKYEPFRANTKYYNIKEEI